ncbi:MAG TPA: lysophospholipid acyltransferase family protein [Gammaproteobacteria bacterium]
MRLLEVARQWAGSILFTLYLFLSVLVYGPLVLLTAPFPHRVRYRAALVWVDSVLYLLRVLCRLDYVVEGQERLPAENTVLLVKHSSAWETIAQLRIFPRQTWVVKRELLWAPVFGWVLPLLKTIAIDRQGGRSAVQQVIDQGLERLAEGFWVVIFPEGTRVPIGQTRRYGLSGALLAAAAGRPVVPVAHNAGYFWRRRGWLKRPGTVRVVIGPPIPTAGRDPREVNEEAQRWIERTVAEIAPPQAAPR